MSPGRPDREVVRRHLLALDAAVRQLEAHAGVSLDDLRADRDLSWAVERGLQLCAQNTLDVATHIAASAGHDAPDYAFAVDALAELGVLPSEFAAKFRAVAGFRNVLVHGYLDVDIARLHEVLTTRLDDFRAFARCVERYLGAG